MVIMEVCKWDSGQNREEVKCLLTHKHTNALLDFKEML